MDDDREHLASMLEVLAHKIRRGEDLGIAICAITQDREVWATEACNEGGVIQLIGLMTTRLHALTRNVGG